MKNLYLLFCLLCLSFLAFSQLKPIENPQIKWKFKSDAPIRGGLVSDEKHVYFGNSNGSVYCIEKETGKQVWHYQTLGAITSGPALANNYLIISSRDNAVYALNPVDGELIWNFEMKKPTPHTWGWDYYDASPAVHDGMVYIGSGDNSLYALNIESGKLKWQYRTQDKIRASPVISGENIFVPSFDGFLYALTIKNGRLNKKYKTEGVDYYGEIHGWDKTSLISKPALQDSLLVFGSRDGGLYCINANTFKKKWRFSYGTSWVGSSPIISDNMVYVGWSDNLLFSAVDLTTGKELWNYNCGAYVYSTPAVDEKNVYVGAFNGKIFGFNKQSGGFAWEIQTGAPVLSSPLLDQGVIYIGNDNGDLFAIEEGREFYKAVYYPEFDKEHPLLSEKLVAPYLQEYGYQKLDTITLTNFMKKRIEDQKASVIVFSHQYLPKAVSGESARQSLLKKYMEAGGKVVWLNYFPNLWTTDKSMNVTGSNPQYAIDLLKIDFDINIDYGTYFAKATPEGLKWSLPASFNAPGSSISDKSKVIPLALNEFGRIAAFWKPFGDKKNSGFVSFCSWSDMPIKQSDLETIKAIAEYGF